MPDMKRHTHFFFSLLLLSFLGCLPPPPPLPLSLGEAEKKFTELCRNEYKITPVLFREANTLWIYVPTGDSLFSLKVSEDGPQEPQPPSEARQLFFIDTKFVDDSFRIRYDIGKAKKSADSPGYGFQYSKELQETQRHLLTAISQTFADVERREGTPGLFLRVAGDVDYLGEENNAKHKKLVHSYVKTERVPDFFVLVIADIKTGLETKMYFYLDDILRGMTDSLFMEEYTRRVMNEGATGNLAIVGDKTGQHLKIHDLTWPEFLSKQITHRIRFKYTQSDLKPEDNAESVLLAIAAQTTKAYNFKNFTAVELINVAQDTQRIFDKQQLNVYLEDNKNVGGK